uniref:NADH-ubiquinone oxidoreductase chain 1 n=1 Tax=Cassida sp. EMHAU-15090501 TaxID=2480058 RepID=A0A3G3C772_9CUCU|nr:NADH dehydrogenase subunit 1 [Cassida sp. EMHAU-15090501]
MENILYYLFVYLILVVFVLISVAFLTLFERKVLGYIQIRKGPNKSGFIGLLQPFSDAVKLFTKEQTFPFMSNFFIYYYSPLFMMLISMMLWMSMPFYFFYLDFSYSVLFFLCFSSLGVYGVMMAGWSSNSTYSLLGSIRCIAQTISYEISLVLIIMSFIFFTLSYSFSDFSVFQLGIWFIFMMFPLSIMLVVSLLAETNRTPFDLAEGESELVSGFNVEYSSGGFAMIFMSEYMNILFMSMIMTLFCMGGDYYTIFFYFKLTFFSFLWIWVRGSFPRYRYDKLMNLTWMVFLPLSLFFLLFHFNLIVSFKANFF